MATRLRNYLHEKMFDISTWIHQTKRNKKARQRLKNHSFSILTNYCIGGVIYHDLGMKFLSPTINMYIYPDDFIKMVNNIQHYLRAELVEDINNQNRFPVGILDDIKIYFVHYSSFSESIDAWERRKQRINFDNLFIMMNEKVVCFEDDKKSRCCSDETFKNFERLPYENKIFFTRDKKYRKVANFAYLKYYAKKPFVNLPNELMPLNGKRRFEKNFDYVSFLNKGGNSNA